MEKTPDTVSLYAWLVEALGPVRHQWNTVDRYDEIDYYFKNPNDATLFALRWS
jgi:hypothetical protein